MKSRCIRKRATSAIGICSLIGLLVMPCRAESANTAQLLESAAGPGTTERYAAIDDLGERHEAAPEVVPQLKKLLKDDDAHVRWRSARALGDYNSLAQDAAGDLRSLLADKDPVVQYHAAVAMGRIGDQSDETIRALVAAATSKDGRVARAAIAALRNLKPEPKHVMAVLSEALKSNDKAVITYALEAITERGAEAVPLLTEALKQPQTTYLACAAIEQIGPDAAPLVPALAELLGKTRHSQLLIQALLALASIGPAAQSAAPQVAPLLEMASDSTVPVAAAYALGAIGAKNNDEDLRRALSKDNPFLQMISAWSLAKLHPNDEAALKLAVDKLIAGLKSNDAAIRTAAARGLEKLQAPAELVAPALIAVANDPDPEVEANIVLALAGLGESVVPRASNALQNPKLRGLAVRVLNQLGPKAASAVPALVRAAADADDSFRSEINFALASIGPSAAPATEVLVDGIGSDEEHVRQSALFALREIGPGAMAAVKPLIQKTQSKESADALAAAWALAAIAPTDANAAAKSIPVLTRGLSSSDELVRIESAEALGAWGKAAAQAAPALKALAHKDSSSVVRQAAEAAFARIGQGP